MSGFYEYFSDKDFEEGKRLLLEAIENDRKNTSDIKKQGFLFELSQHPINSIKDLQEVDYLYNDGKLRSYEEVSFRNSYIAVQNKRDNYDEIRHKRNTKYFLIPFFVTFTITLIIIRDIIFGPLLALLFGFIAAYIGGIKGYNKNIQKAEEYYIPKDDPRVQDEILKKKVAIASGIAAGVSIGRHAKKVHKDFINVDGWKEMK